MSPRIVRPRSDDAHWLVGALAASLSLVFGYVGATKVFRPESQSANRASESGTSAPATDEQLSVLPDAPAAADAGSASRPRNGYVEEPEAVRVRVLRGVVQSCGDGEELTLLGTNCAGVPGLEEMLRRQLQRLGTCASARAAAANPDATLSLGLRVDFPRRRITPLPGRSSTVRDPLAHVACARQVVTGSDDLWRIQPPHSRYLYYFAVRFGPLDPGVPAPASRALQASPALSTAVSAPVAATHSSTANAATQATMPVRPLTVASSGTASSPSEPSYGMRLRHAEPAVVTQSPHAIVRDAPRTGAVIARLPPGTALVAIGRDGGWFEVRWARGTGWVFGAAIQRSGFDTPRANP